MTRRLVPVNVSDHVEVVRHASMEGTSVEVSYHRMDKDGDLQSVTRWSFGGDEWRAIADALDAVLTIDE